MELVNLPADERVVIRVGVCSDESALPESKGIVVFLQRTLMKDPKRFMWRTDNGNGGEDARPMLGVCKPLDVQASRPNSIFPNAFCHFLLRLLLCHGGQRPDRLRYADPRLPSRKGGRITLALSEMQPLTAGRKHYKSDLYTYLYR